MFCYLVSARYAEINAALADKGRYVRCGEEDEREGEVLDEGDVEAGVSVELYVASGEEVKGRGVKTALCGIFSAMISCAAWAYEVYAYALDGGHTLWDREQQSVV